MMSERQLMRMAKKRRRRDRKWARTVDKDLAVARTLIGRCRGKVCPTRG